MSSDAVHRDSTLGDDSADEALGDVEPLGGLVNIE
ncbi:MAG: hypothetical protein QOD92_3241 [Acidimicrobiaceae bacterium]